MLGFRVLWDSSLNADHWRKTWDAAFNAARAILVRLRQRDTQRLDTAHVEPVFRLVRDHANERGVTVRTSENAAHGVAVKLQRGEGM
jgi:hypothetical protein